MAYSKQTWTDDVSAVTGARMTHIEQGIYDNSIATDKINPSGTATTTAEIEEGQINDVIGFKSLKLKGQTSQYTTNGYQLFDINNTPSANRQYVINNGFKLTKGTNRTIQISLPNPIPAGTYYISADVINSTLSGNNKINVSFKDANNTDVVANVTFLTNGAVTTTAEVKDLYFFIISSEADTATITLDNIMLNSGSTKKDFEKYTGGKASPNPDFPQDVNNVSGDNVIGISNKNINSSTLEVGNISNGANTTDTNVVRSKDYIMVTPSTAYVFGINGTANKVVVSMYDENKVFLTNDGANGYASSNGKFTTYSNAKYIRYRCYSADKSLFESGNIQLEKGNSASTYIAHQGNNFDINLGAIELCKIGAYADYIYKKDGKWWKHKEIGRKTLNGSETWTRESTNTSGKGRFQINLGNLTSNNIVKPSSNANVGLILSDLFIAVVAGTNGTYGCHEGISLDINGYVQIYDETQYGSDVATFKTWLANNNTNLYWVYATPIEEEITYTPLIRQLDELYNSGLYDVTNISQDNSSEAFILDIEACKNNINGIVEYIRR